METRSGGIGGSRRAFEARTILLAFLESTGNLYLNELLSEVQVVFGNSVSILKIRQNVYPEIIESFQVGHFPTLVLVRRGIELWRGEGILSYTDLRDPLFSKLHSLEDTACGVGQGA